MGFDNVVKNIKGTIFLEVEGFFIERFINLCKTNNIQVWDLNYITTGLIRVKASSKEFKTIKKIAKKTKCKVKIKKKKGIYFILFKYRKRRLFLYLACLFTLILIAISTFIFRIRITGLENIPEEVILTELEKSGVSAWRNKLFINSKTVTNALRTNVYEIAWVGMEIKGSTVYVDIVEKIIENEDADKDAIGDIIASKSGVITKIIADNGIAKFLTGSYIEEGMVAISGIIPSEFIGEQYVHASGIVRVKNEYTYKNEKKYKEKEKVYVDKNRYGIGIDINNKEYILKYLPKGLIYDINKKEQNMTVISKPYKMLFVKYKGYEMQTIERNYDEIVDIAEKEYRAYTCKEIVDDKKVLEENIEINKNESGIEYVVKYVVEEEVRSI